MLIPEFVLGVTRLANVLHGQSGLALKVALDRPDTVVTSVPFHVRTTEDARPSRVAPLHELDRQRRTARSATTRLNDDGTSPPRRAHVPLGQRVEVPGEVTQLRVVPWAGSPSLEVLVDDGWTSRDPARRRVRRVSRW